jgi:hypothetical protein
MQIGEGKTKTPLKTSFDCKKKYSPIFFLMYIFMLTLDLVPNFQGNLGHSALVLGTLWITLLFRNSSLKNPPDERKFLISQWAKSLWKQQRKPNQWEAIDVFHLMSSLFNVFTSFNLGWKSCTVSDYFVGNFRHFLKKIWKRIFYQNFLFFFF